MASPKRAAQRCEPTLITFISLTISRLCSSCHTDWSLVLSALLLLPFPLCHTAWLLDCQGTVYCCPMYLSGFSRQSQDAAWSWPTTGGSRSIRKPSPETGISSKRHIKCITVCVDPQHASLIQTAWKQAQNNVQQLSSRVSGFTPTYAACWQDKPTPAAG